MWNQRYDNEEYAYGTEPNSFLAEHARILSGPVLSLAEGEGRNAVFLATLGLDVLGVDGSAVGLAKAQRLAALKGVAIRTEVADLATHELPENHYGSITASVRLGPESLQSRSGYPLSTQLSRLVRDIERPVKQRVGIHPRGQALEVPFR
jgi:hypothetical protein